MILVSIDTSTKYASIGITNLEQSYFYNWESQYNHGVELTKNLRTLLGNIKADASDITHLAVALGPGGFSSVRLSLLDRGFVYAIAHIRGSQYLGRQWYEDGKMFNKKNTFWDFIDSAKFLAKNNFVDEDQIFAMGGSAGGLLMGAVANMEPEVFKGIIAGVPFVDVVTTMLDETIPLTTFEFDEWGDPKNKDSYFYMLSYSPYDQVEEKDYPAIFITTGYHDSQVQYFEPAKWIARLRDRRTNKEPLLMYCNMDAGHGGASGRFEAYKETAMEYAFLISLTEN